MVGGPVLVINHVYSSYHSVGIAQEPSFSSSMACLFGEEAPLSLSPHANFHIFLTMGINPKVSHVNVM